MPQLRSDGTLRRTWPQRLLVAFNACVIVVALLAAGSLAYAKRTVSQIKRTTTAPGLLKNAEDLKPGEPENFLIVGVDSDDGLAADDPARAGRDTGREAVTGLRSDTIMIVRVDPKSTSASILSFPRDLWVDIPGEGKNRINAAVIFGDGTPNLLIRTIKENFGIDISHYVQVDLAGFQGLVNVLGGIPIWFSTPVRDNHAGLHVDNAGCTNLDQNGALAYARSRHFEYYDEDRGRWVHDAASDLARIDRQQDFIRRVIRRAIKQGWRNPTKLVSFVNIGVQNITLDEFTSPQDLITLGKRFRNFDPDSLKSYSLPVTDTFRGGAEVLDLNEDEAQPILDVFRGTGSAMDQQVTAADVKVQVLNGTGKSNQAADTAGRLAAVGFTTRPPGSTSSVLRTEVRYRPGDEAAAVLVARYLGADPTLVPDPDASMGEVTVVTGPDFFAARDTPRPASEITTTISTTTSTTSTTTTTLPAGNGSASTSTVPGSAGEVLGREAHGYLPGDPPPGESCG